jgi:hypothetical protein
MSGNGFSGTWLVTLAVVVVAGIAAWMVARNKK